MSLSRAIEEALQLRAELKAKGLPAEELAHAFTAAVRDVWPKAREWKYLCQACAGYGLEMHACPGDRTCGRSTEHGPHEFGKPCWCSAGKPFRDKPAASPSQFTDAGKTPKRQMSRFGQG